MLLFLIFTIVSHIWVRRKKSFSYPRRMVMVSVIVLTGLVLGACSNEDMISAQKYDQDLAALEDKMSTLSTEKENLQAQLDEYKVKNESLLQRLADAEETVDQKIKEAEVRLREEFEVELQNAEEAAKQRADEEIAAIRKEEADKAAAAIAKAKKEFEQQAQNSSNADSNNQTTNTTEHFQNCTELKGTYPGGVSSDHPAYQSKMDRDNDGWACE